MTVCFKFITIFANHWFAGVAFQEGVLRVTRRLFGYCRKWQHIIDDIETAAQRLNCRTIIIDDLTYLCNSSDKSVDAGILMMKLMALKKNTSDTLLSSIAPPSLALSK